MTLEERVERLETFMGDIDKITSVYANSVQEICDKYLNLLYIETADVNHPEKLVLDGFLSELDTAADLPHNVVFNVRPSHTFAYGEGENTSSKIKFKRDNKIIELPLKKYDASNPGTLVFLEPGDYIMGITYNIYIDSQNIAIISSSDTGTVALQEVTQLASAVAEIVSTIAALSTSQEVASLTVTNGTVENLTITDSLTLGDPVALPLNSTCSQPDNDTDIANKKYVDDTVDAAIRDWYNSHHLFTTNDPATVLNDAPDKSICYKY